MPPKNPSDPEPLHFDEAIVSFNGYTSLAKIPRILFLRINQVIEREGKPMDTACEAIARILKVSRDEVKAKLSSCQPRSSEAGSKRTHPKPEAWPSVRSIHGQDRD